MNSLELFIDSPTKPFLNIDEVVAHAESIIRDADEGARVLFRQWAWLGERQLGFGGYSEETKDLPVEDLSIRKPSDMATPIDIALYDASGSDYQYKYHEGKNRIHNVDPSKAKIDLSEDPYYFHLGSNGSLITYAKLRYYAYPIDDDNNPMFPEHHLLAIMFFIRWMWETTKGKSQSAIQQAEDMWIRQSMKAKSANKMPSQLKGAEIVKTWMSMIDKVRFNDF
jgi:hypothetical protein